MNPIKDLQDQVKTSNNEDNLIYTMFRIMREFGYTIEEFLDIPVTTYNIMVEMINKEDKIRNKPLKGGKK